MDIGKLRHRVTIRRPAGSRDAVGARVTTWVLVAVVWGNVRPLTSSEKFQASQRNASTTLIVEIRYSRDVAAIDSTWRIDWGSRVLVLDGDPINVGEDNAQFNLPCVVGLRDE